jgi:hypothetical protein
MDALSTAIVCDGCGLPASVGHMAQRLERLELATRFRPIHINVLFVTSEPMARLEDDFYRPPESRGFFDSFLTALDISPDAGGAGSNTANLLEFQRRGYYLTYLSECPITARPAADSNADMNLAEDCIPRLAPTLVKRIRFNYKPKYVALLGASLQPLIEIFQQSGIGPLLLLDRGGPLALPRTDDPSSLTLFRRTVMTETPSAATSSGV